MALDNFQRSRVRNAVSAVNNGETTEIDLRKLSLGAIPPAVFSCTKVATLDLSHDYPMTEGNVYLDEEFWWENDMDNNQISTIPSDIGRLTNLERLDLAQNSVSAIPPEIGELRKLRHLNLRNNYLTELPGAIGALQALEVLDLSYNQLAELPAEVGNLRNLRELYLNSNALGALPPELCGLRNLRVLDLGNYDQQKVWKDTVERYSLVRNRLSSLPECFGDLESLRVLNLEHNRFTGLPNVLTELVALESFRFNGNPVEDDWILDHLDETAAWIWWYFQKDPPPHLEE
jgi:Leucine-rich repeat (LRR) protein